jgi:hypothetical protein
MGKYNTSKGITWSDEDGGFQADDIIKMYNAYQDSALANAANLRAEKALLMQQEKIDYAKDINNKIIKGQQFFNHMAIDLTKSGWNEDGVWDAENVNPTERVNDYLSQMESIGQAGDGINAYNTVQTMHAKKLAIGGAQLQAKIQAWEIEHKDDFGQDDYIPFNETFKEERKKYIKKIGGDRIYRQAWGLGGEAGGEGMALQITGLTKDDFATDDEWSNWEIAGGVGAVGGATWLGSKGWTAMGDSIARGDKLLLDKAEGQSALKKLRADLKILRKGGSKEALAGAAKMERMIDIVAKRGYIDKASWSALDKMQEGLPKVSTPAAIKAKSAEASKAAKALKGIDEPTKTSQILKKAKNAFSLEELGKKGKQVLKTGGKLLGFGVASELASNLGESVGGEKGAKVAEIATGVGSTALFDKAFWKWSAGKLKGRLAQRAAVAGAASLADGPLPIADAISAFVIAGFTISDIAALTTEWDNLSNK